MVVNGILNKQAYDDFKSAIDYAGIKSSLSNSRYVLMDWYAMLDNFVDDSGQKWKVATESSAPMEGKGLLSATLENAGKYVAMDITVLSGPNYSALDEVLAKLSMTMRVDINYKQTKSGPGDVYFSLSEGNENKSGVFTFNNTVVMLTAMDDDGDVLPLARSLVKAMNGSVVARDALPMPGYKIHVSHNKIKSGDDFMIDVAVSGKKFAAEINMDDIADNIEFLGGQFQFKALAAGAAKIKFHLWNREGLLCFPAEIDVKVAE